MRIAKILLAATALFASAGAAFAVNPPAENASGLVLHSVLSELSGRTADVADPIADVKPGQTLTITGECVMQVKSVDHLQVVLALTGAAEPGYHAVVATDQEYRDNELQVRVPDMPEAANRVFQVKIFHLGAQMPEICDAGSIRIGGTAPEKVG